MVGVGIPFCGLAERSRRLPVSPPEEIRVGSKFKSVRRTFKILDLISRHGEGLTAKQIARELEISLSNSYYLINILLEEGYIEKDRCHGGYRLGSSIPLLHDRYFESNIVSAVEPIIDELARRIGRHVYFGLLSNGDVTVADVKCPPKNPPVEIVKGSQGASHALALGKVLLAGIEPEIVRGYVEDYGLEAFTPRTIIRSNVLEAHLRTVNSRGVAVDLEEFAENLCCVAVPVKGVTGGVEGAIGISTSARSFQTEAPLLVELAQEAAGEATALLREHVGTGPKQALSR